MKRTPKPDKSLHHCPTCKRLSALANDEPKNCLWCGEKAVEVGQELPFDDMELDETKIKETYMNLEFVDMNKVINQHTPIGRNTSLAKQDGYDYDFAKDKTSEQAADQYNEANPVIFVYQKDGATKALSFHEAKEQAKEIEADGWAHVATLDAKVFVEDSYREAGEAQDRYDAAEKYIEENKGHEWCDYLEAVDQALKIAAGLKID